MNSNPPTAADEASLGIFWFVLDTEHRPRMLAQTCSLSQAEAYGECLTFGPGHYEVWNSWRLSGCPEASLAATVQHQEYEEWPRGRVVFDTGTGRFQLYADRRIQAAGLVGQVVKRFSLPEKLIDIRSDAHYRSRLAITPRPEI